MRNFVTFSWKEASFRISSTHVPVICEAIQRERDALGEYIARFPRFQDALSPIELLEPAPEIAERMHRASLLTGVGPMAAVAGAVAQRAAEAALTAAAKHGETGEAIVENGGDIFLAAAAPVVIGLYSGNGKLSGRLAFRILPEQTPLSICSSSSKLGHSLSFGDCDLATVAAADGALADACATLTCNSVRRLADIEPALAQAMAIPGVRGVLIIKDDHLGLAGELPELMKHADAALKDKITRAAGVIV